jgi:hypothetical protein
VLCAETAELDPNRLIQQQAATAVYKASERDKGFMSRASLAKPGSEGHDAENSGTAARPCHGSLIQPGEHAKHARGNGDF